MTREEQYYDAIASVARRYHNDGLVQDDEELHDFTVLLVINCENRRHSLEKMNRWLGYLQGRLVEQNKITVENERDLTRPLFKPLDGE